MGNRVWTGGASVALALVVLPVSSFAKPQSTDSQSFPTDPYASSTGEVFSNPYDTETSGGFSADPFGSNTDQSTNSSGAKDQNEGLRDVGTTAKTGVGEVGQRQTAVDTAPGQSQLDRVDNRVQNRVQNRIRNRIDRTYDPTANATSPFKDANQRSQNSGQGR